MFKCLLSNKIKLMKRLCVETYTHYYANNLEEKFPLKMIPITTETLT